MKIDKKKLDHENSFDLNPQLMTVLRNGGIRLNVIKLLAFTNLTGHLLELSKMDLLIYSQRFIGSFHIIS